MYDESFFNGTDDPLAPRTRTRQERAAEARILHRLVPDQFFRAQLEVIVLLSIDHIPADQSRKALFNANPHLADRFPGGLIQLVQAVIRMSEEEIDQLLVDHIVIDEAGGMGHQDAAGIDVPDGDRQGVMPGQMPDDDVVSLQFLAPEEVLREVEDEAELPMPALELPEDHNDAATDSSEEEEEDIAVRTMFFVVRRISSLMLPEPAHACASSQEFYQSDLGPAGSF
jgi:hypothetical protein